MVDKYVMTFPQNFYVMEFYQNLYKPYKNGMRLGLDIRFILFFELYTSVMSSARFSVALDNGHYVKVSTWNGEPRLDLREWKVGEDKMIPTKKGISLKLHHIKILTSILDSIQKTREDNGENKWHLGYNAFVRVREDNPCVDIRQYWVPPGVDESVPTKRGLCFRPAEFAVLIQNWSGIENQLPELKDFVPCYEEKDHLSQLELLRCPACNPEGHDSW